MYERYSIFTLIQAKYCATYGWRRVWTILTLGPLTLHWHMLHNRDFLMKNLDFSLWALCPKPESRTTRPKSAVRTLPVSRRMHIAVPCCSHSCTAAGCTRNQSISTITIEDLTFETAKLEDISVFQEQLSWVWWSGWPYFKASAF